MNGNKIKVIYTGRPIPVADQRRQSRGGRRKSGSGLIFMAIRRTLLVLLLAVVFLAGTVLSVCSTVANGPSETFRNMLVLSALQASATKWVPGLFLDDATVQKILDASKTVTVDELPLDYYNPASSSGSDTETEDEWADCPDGVKLVTVNGSTYKAYLLLIKDPTKVIVGTSSNYVNSAYGMRIFEMVDKYNALAAINGGEFNDAYGQGTGATPMGLTYSQGKCVWTDAYRRTFMGFDADNRLIVRESMTKKEAEALGIRDAVCFQTGNTLISSESGVLKCYYIEGDNGTAQRTAIGQRADGTVIFLVTDGRSASSLGATHNDVIDLMLQYGAVTAGKLDGGSSSMMYYRDYYKKYNIDENTLDSYQKQGLVNKYKAFTNPRRIPTYFLVLGNS